MPNLCLIRSLPRARNTDPATSHEAAAKVDGKALAERVLANLRDEGPGTSHDLAERMGLSLVTVSPRLKPLEEAGKVVRGPRRHGRTIWIYAGRD